MLMQAMRDICRTSANGQSHLLELTRSVCQSLSPGGVSSTPSGGEVFRGTHQFIHDPERRRSDDAIDTTSV
jgi:hypothetical protein